MLYWPRKHGIGETSKGARGVVLAISEGSGLGHAALLDIGFLECTASVVKGAKLD